MTRSKNRWMAMVAAAAVVAAWLSAGVPPGASAAPAKSRYIVVLDDATPDAGVVAADHSRANGAEVSHVYRAALQGYAARMSAQHADAIRRDPRVSFVVPDGDVQATAQTLPTGVDRMEADLSSTAAGNGAGTVDVPVAIIDTGIDTSHPELNVKGGRDCTLGLTYNDANGHGTHVAGSVAARDNGSGVVGVAPGAPLYAVRVLDATGAGLNSWVICGIDWVTQNATTLGIKVANMSLGGSGTDYGNCGNGKDAMHKAICNSIAKGVTYLVAAGNDNKDLKSFTPAAYDEVLTVSAIADFNGRSGGGAKSTCRSDVDDTAADFSNWTTAGHADVNHTIAAPGTCIRSTWMLGGYNTISGTSMASPHVAGQAALCIGSGKCSGLSPSGIMSKLRSDAAAQPASSGFKDDPNTPNGSRYYGHLAYAGGY